MSNGKAALKREDAGATPPPQQLPDRGEVKARLEQLGFTSATFDDEALRWRWRLVNVALRAGSGGGGAAAAGDAGGHSMTASQLHFLRAELDFRMLHVRLAAIVRHCFRALIRASTTANGSDRGGKAQAGERMDVDDVKEEQEVAGPSAEPAVSNASEGSSLGGSAGLARQVRMNGTMHNAQIADLFPTKLRPSSDAPDHCACLGCHGIACVLSADGRRQTCKLSSAFDYVIRLVQGGSVEECLQREHSSFLSAALSVPLTVLHSVLHDVAASLTFRAACASAARLSSFKDSAWCGALRASSHVKQVRQGLRVDFWPACPLLCPPSEVHASSTDAGAGGAARKATGGSKMGTNVASGEQTVGVEVGIRSSALAVALDPPLEQLWAAGDVESVTGTALPRVPALDLVTGDMEPVLRVRTLLLVSRCYTFGKLQSLNAESEFYAQFFIMLLHPHLLCGEI